jgi:hypothetical protein
MSARLSGNLPSADKSFSVLSAGGRRLGVVIQNAEGRYVAWTNKKLGDFASAIEADNAVRVAAKTKTKKPE